MAEMMISLQILPDDAYYSIDEAALQERARIEAEREAETRRVAKLQMPVFKMQQQIQIIPDPVDLIADPARVPFTNDEVVRNIRAALEQVITDEDDTSVALDTPLMDLGLDSLNSISFRNDLSKSFDISLPSTFLYDHPTIAAQ